MNVIRQRHTIRVRPGGALRGSATVPADKSLSHRALILGALAAGTSQIRGWLRAGDTLAALDCIRALGITAEYEPDVLTVHGRGLHGLQTPATPLNCVNAGTALRLLAGVLAGQPFASVLDGSDQLRGRPMRRIIDPLRQMGAQITDHDGRAPLIFSPSTLRGLAYHMPVASAQVKSCLLLAGLFADGPTTVIEPGPARDHTERMLRALGGTVQSNGAHITLTPGGTLRPLEMHIPGDISSAAFLLVAALLHPESRVQLAHIGVNPTRIGLLDILAAMGVTIDIQDRPQEAGEPVAALTVQGQPLRGVEIGGDLVVRAIDEFPVLMVVATQAAGETVVRDAAELRVKETDRIAVMAGELRKLGAEIEEYPDGFRVVGPQTLRGAVVDGHDDHRVAMALAVAGMLSAGETTVTDAACVHDSFPGFVETLQPLGADIAWVNDD